MRIWVYYFYKVRYFDLLILVEELECLATWKEGSLRFLVGKLHHNHATSNEDRYRCFVYEKTNGIGETFIFFYN